MSFATSASRPLKPLRMSHGGTYSRNRMSLVKPSISTHELADGLQFGRGQLHHNTGGEMDLEGANGFCGLRRGQKVNEGRGVIGVGIAVLADPVLKLRVLHAMHLTPRTLALAAALPLLDECKHLLTTGFPFGLRFPLKV